MAEATLNRLRDRANSLQARQASPVVPPHAGKSFEDTLVDPAPELRERPVATPARAFQLQHQVSSDAQPTEQVVWDREFATTDDASANSAPEQDRQEAPASVNESGPHASDDDDDDDELVGDVDPEACP